MRGRARGMRVVLPEQERRVAPVRWPYVPAVVLAGLLLVGGCQRSAHTPPSLEFTRYRVNGDEKRGVARVVGEIANRGTAPVHEVEVHATLIGTTGSERGRNMVRVRNLQPGEPCAFALNVTTHGPVSNVQLTWALPGEDVDRTSQGEAGQP